MKRLQHRKPSHRITTAETKKTLRDHMCDKGIHQLGPRTNIVSKWNRTDFITETAEFRKEHAKIWKLDHTLNNPHASATLIFIKRHESMRRCKNCKKYITVHHKKEYEKIKEKKLKKSAERSPVQKSKDTSVQ